jgi:hypothetical protein
MKEPEADIDNRTPIWDVLQELFMDTDVMLAYQHIATVCSQSKYTIEELHDILFQEVLPALRGNLYALPAPEWRGFETACLVERILKKHQFGKSKPWIGRKYIQQQWKILLPLILLSRAESL